MDQLDFASPVEGLGGKLSIDATVKIGAETTRPFAATLAMPEEVERRADDLFDRMMAGRETLGAPQEVILCPAV